MASTYSTNLKIELMGTGENSGTWGTITNTNLGTAFEQAVIGLGNPDYTSDANLTITLTNTNASQAARCLVLNVTSAFGSLTATRELIVPTIQKQYIVQNNTTGGQSITVKTSAGTGITVPTGRKAHLYVDGTNVIQMFDFVDINGGTIDGATVGAASASTGAFTSLTASGATTLNGAVALGDASGDLITVPGTVNSNLLFTDATYDIGASGATRPRDMFLSRNLTVGGTLTLAGGVNLNGNVTVGDSSADTLTINSTITSNLIFTDNTYDIGASGATRPRSLFLAGNITAAGNQTLTGALTVDSTTDSSSTTTGSIQTDGGVGIAKALFVGTTANIAGVATFSAGSAAAPAITTTGDTNTGIWFPAADTIAFTEGGVESMRIDSAGNLGLGVTPSAWSLLKAFQIGNTSLASYSGTGYLMTNAYFDGSVYRYTSSNYANLYTQNNSVGQHAWNVAASGTAGDTISFTQAMALDASGRLGIGETSPAQTLVLKNTSSAPYLSFIAGASSAMGVLMGTAANTVDGQIVYSNSTQALTFVTASAERMRIDSAGNVGIGTSSPAVKLDVVGAETSGIVNVARLRNPVNSAGTGHGASLILHSTTDSNRGVAIASSSTANFAVDNAMLFYTSASSTLTEKMRITSAGRVCIGTTEANRILNVYESESTAVSSSTFFNASYGGLYLRNTSNTTDTVCGIGFSGGAGGNSCSGIGNILESVNLGALGFFTGGASVSSTAPERMRITSAGNVGIGTSSPSQKLHVASTSNAQGLFETTGAGGGSNRSSVILQGPSNTWYINTNGSDLNGSDGALGFYGNSATRMVIDTSGNVSISSTTEATSTTTASLKTAGGLGVAKKAYFGDDIFIRDLGRYQNGNALTPTNTTRTYTFSSLVCQFIEITISQICAGGRGHSCAKWVVFGEFAGASANNFTVQEIFRTNTADVTGSSTISAITKAVGSFSFTVQNSSSAVQAPVAYQIIISSDAYTGSPTATLTIT